MGPQRFGHDWVTEHSALSKPLLGGFEFSIYLQSDSCKSCEAGGRIPSFRSSRGLSQSGFQVNYFLFFSLLLIVPRSPSTLPSTHTFLATSRQFCSKPIFVSQSALEHPPLRALGFLPECSNVRAKLCHYCRIKRAPSLLVTFCVTYWPFVLRVPACKGTSWAHLPKSFSLFVTLYLCHQLYCHSFQDSCWAGAPSRFDLFCMKHCFSDWLSLPIKARVYAPLLSLTIQGC